MTCHRVAPGELESECGIVAARLSNNAGEQSPDWADCSCPSCLEYQDEDCTTDAGPPDLRLGAA